MSAIPYVSFVTYGRNDGYTPTYMRRAIRATNCLAHQLERAGIDSEIVFIEWNPPADRQSPLEMFDLPARLNHVSVRGFTVPNEYHDRLPNVQPGGFHSGEAANTGIRRARGRFITSKASDTFYTNAVFEKIAARTLDADTMYRIDRHDIIIDSEAIWDLPDDAMLEKMESLPSSPHAWIDQTRHWRLRELHTNACGDFTLMSAAYWRYLRGHPRDPYGLSLDVDSLVMHAAAALGVREQRWPDDCRVYKPTHGNLNSARIQQHWRSWQKRLDKMLSEKVSEESAHWARVTFDYPRRKVRGVDSVIGPSIERNLVQPASRWARGEKPMPTQPEGWGLGNAPLPERMICRADWDIVEA